jgi:hypothetical protein
LGRVGQIARAGNLGTPSSASSVLLEQNDEWAVKRAPRYMTLETMATFRDDPIVGLPPMVI